MSQFLTTLPDSFTSALDGMNTAGPDVLRKVFAVCVRSYIAIGRGPTLAEMGKRLAGVPDAANITKVLSLIALSAVRCQPSPDAFVRRLRKSLKGLAEDIVEALGQVWETEGSDGAVPLTSCPVLRQYSLRKSHRTVGDFSSAAMSPVYSMVIGTSEGTVAFEMTTESARDLLVKLRAVEAATQK